MNFKHNRLVRLLALVLAVSLFFSFSAMAADDLLNEHDEVAPYVRETEVPVEVGSLVTGTALGMGTVMVQGVNVRENPNMDAGVVTVLNQGDQVVVLSKDGDWYRISSEDLTGFIMCEYLSIAEEGQADLGYGMIKVETANVRASATEESEAISSIDSEDVVTITGIYNGWYEVVLDDGVGYVLSDLVDPTADIPDEKIYDYVVIDVNGANLRTSADASSEKVDMLYGSSLCTLLEEVGDWYKVQYGNTVGYVSCDLVSTTNDASDGSTGIKTYNTVVAEQEAARKAAEEAARKAAAANKNNYSSSSSSSSSSGSSSSSSSGSYNPTYNSYGSGSILSVAQNYLGVPYVWGGTSPSGFDCSGFTQYVFRQCGYSINRTADAQYYNGSYVSYDNLQAGDLVFFSNTYSSAGITHVGIYMGDGNFIHAANGGVKITSLSSSYYSSRYYGARRIA